LRSKHVAPTPNPRRLINPVNPEGDISERHPFRLIGRPSSESAFVNDAAIIGSDCDDAREAGVLTSLQAVR
jgi:hypothetical protein